ncbi:Uncharacterized protein FKW44_006406, partial [Caligus rogercresseyi]
INNSTIHAFAECQAVGILKRFVILNVKSLGKESADKYSKTLLFGMGNNAKSSCTKAINFTILNAKALIVKKITSWDPLHPYELRSVLLSAAARYGALELKIPSLQNEV